jgi:hypothetical protein
MLSGREMLTINALFLIDHEDEAHQYATARAIGKHQWGCVEQTGRAVHGQGATGGCIKYCSTRPGRDTKGDGCWARQGSYHSKASIDREDVIMVGVWTW